MSESQTDKLSRRSFLKLMAATAVGLGLGPIFGNTSKNHEIEGAEDIFGELRKRILGSGLIESSVDKERISKERLLDFLKRADKAMGFFLIFHEKEKSLDEIRALTRYLYPNPDIDVDDQIFFLRDEKILRGGLLRLYSMDWQNRGSLEKNLLEILTTPQMMHSLSEENLAKDLWFSNPEKIASLYSEIGAKKPSNMKFDETALTGEFSRKKFVERAKGRIASALQDLPLHSVTVKLQSTKGDEKRPFWGHTVSNIVLGNSVLELGVVSDKEHKWDKERVEIVSIHEAIHAIDLQDNPGLVKYLNVKEILELYTLRLEAALDTQIPQADKVLMRKKLGGEDVTGRDVGDRMYDVWLIEESLERQLTKEELETLFDIYAHDRWSFSAVLFLSDEVYKLDDLKRSLSKPSNVIYKSWNEFFEGEKVVFDFLDDKSPLLRFVLEKISLNLRGFSSGIPEQGMVVDSWWGRLFFENFRVVIVQDLLTRGEVKNYVLPKQYSDWLKRVPYELRSTNQEKLADEIAFITFLVRSRNIPGLQFESKPSVKYLNKLSEIWERKFVVKF